MAIPEDRLREGSFVHTTLNPQAVDAQLALNWKTYTDAFIATQARADEGAGEHQNRLRLLAEENLAANLEMGRMQRSNAAAFSQIVTARALRMAADISAEQAMGFATQIGSRLEDRLTHIGAAVASLQDFAKMVNTTPPQTGTGGAFGAETGSALQQSLAQIDSRILGLRELLAGGRAPSAAGTPN
jgi:hypothetical protein